MLKQKLTSRKFWVAVAGALLILANEGFNLGIPGDAYWKIVTLLLGYIFGEAAVDIAHAKSATQGDQQDASSS